MHSDERENMIKKIIYIVLAIFLLLSVYIIGTKCFYGEIYLEVGNDGRNEWNTEDLQDVSKGFQIQEDRKFLSLTPDPWFLIETSYQVKTIVIDIDEISENHDSQVFYYSEDQDLDEEHSYYFQLNKGLNYIQIPKGHYNKFRLDLTDSPNVVLGINNITTYGHRCVSSRFLVCIVIIWIVLISIIYNWISRREINLSDNEKSSDKDGEQNDNMKKRKMQSISYLRVIAMGMILYDHLGAMRNNEWVIKRIVDFTVCSPLNIIQNFGALGVCLFYLLTGFLFIYSNRDKSNIISAVCKKITKLYLYTMITFAVFGIFQLILNCITPTYWNQFSIEEWIGCATLVNHFNGVGEMVNGATWFLIPLFIFYLLAAVCYKATKKHVAKTLMLMQGCTVLLGCCGELLMDYLPPEYVLNLIPFINIPIMGMVIYLVAFGEIPFWRGIGIGSLNYIIMIVSFYRLNNQYYAGSPYIISFVYAVLLLIIFISGEQAFRSNKLINFLNEISLSVYLIHNTWGGQVMSLMENKIGFSVAFFVTLGIVIIIAGVHHYWLEKRILKW